MSLAKYIKQRNEYIERMKGWGWSTQDKVMDIKSLAPSDKTELRHDLERDLQPEVLTCDGEIRGAKLVAKQNLLLQAQQELLALV